MLYPKASSPTSSPSANPTAIPTYPCFAFNDGGSRSERRRRHLQDPVPSSELSHRVLQGNWKTWTCEQGQTCALFDAVRHYYLQDCDSNSTCEIGQVWGYPIGTWCVGSVVNMNSLFNGNYVAPLPNNLTWDLSGWDTPSVEMMTYMFGGQKLFNDNLSLWDVSHVNDMWGMFNDAESFNSDSISNWNTSSVTNMKAMFADASSFNDDLSLWDTSSVTKMDGMFNGASSFNGNLSQWDTSSVMSMEQMFISASSFNSSSISNWNVTNVVNMVRMFKGATDFAQNLCPWMDALAVSLSNCYIFNPGTSGIPNQPCTFEMFTNSSGKPNDGSGGFNSALLVPSVF